MNNKNIILIADDEPLGREVLRGLLNQENYELAFAINGKDAIEKATSLVPDLILLDVMMPEIDGFEVCRTLRQDPILTDVVIIMITALDDRDSRLQGIEAGADDFISKPFDRTELRTRIRTITRLNRFKKLLTERNKFEWVVEQTDDGYVITNDTGIILYANPQSLLYLNILPDKQHPIKKKFQDIVKEQYHCEPQQAWSTWPLSTDYLTSPLYLIKADSDTTNAFWLEVTLLQIPSATSETSNDCFFRLRDVTKKMAMQRDMWQFHAIIAHKLRTPLIPLVGGLELLSMHGDEFSQEDINKLITRALKGIHRLREEIDDIVQYTTLLKSTTPSSDHYCNAASIESIAQQIGQEMKLTGLTILSEPLPANVNILLSTQITHLILHELLENAKKFHPDHTPSIQIQITLLNTKAIKVQICDNGITLSPEQLNQVWVPYYQGEKFFTGEAQGMGLGLSMVASSVWNVGGTCRMYNQERKPGIVVELILPIVCQ